MNSRLLAVAVLVTLCLGLRFASAAPPQQVVVSAPRTNIMSGTNVITAASAGQKFDVLSESQGWYQVQVEVGGQKRQGWIRQADVKPVEAVAAAAEPAAAPKVAAAEPGKWLQVTVDSVDVKAGEETVATLRRNQVLPIATVEGAWRQVRIFEDGALKVGYLRENQCRILNASDVGPSLNEVTPYSISSATVKVDWATEDLVLEAAVPVADPENARLMSADGTTPAPNAIEVQITSSAVTARIPGSGWIDLVRTGTRSLWVAEGDTERARRHRIDLPPLDMGTEVTATKYPNFDEGLVLSVPVSGVLPGYQVEHAYRMSSDTVPVIQQLNGSAGTSPRVADMAAGKNSWPHSLRVIVPYAASPNDTMTHVFIIRHPDGSQSRAIEVQRRGDTITGLAREIAPGSVAPVDVTVVVPSVELLSAADAVAAVTAAGLKPLLVDQATFERRDLDKVRDLMILRQGIAAGERIPAGRPLVLGLRADDGVAMVDSFELVDDSTVGLQAPQDGAPVPPDSPKPDVPADAPATQPDAPLTIVEGGGLTGGLTSGGVADGGLTEGGLVQNSTTVNTGEELQFVDVGQTGLIGGSGGLQDVIVPPTGPGSGGLIADTDLGGEMKPPGLDLIPDGTGGLVDSPGGLVVPVNPDPGVLLDPQVDAETALLTGILKIILTAILDRPDPNDLPGPIGAAITQAIQEAELNLRKAKDPAAELAAVTRVLDIVLDKMKLSLADAQKARALEAWTADRQRHLNPSLDRNGNLVLADDVVLFFVVWLHRNGLFNPASQVVINQDGLGNTVALLPNQPVNLDWLKNLPPLTKPGQPIKPLPNPGPKPEPVKPPTDPLASVPQGKAVVSYGDEPDFVKMPDVREELVSRAKQELDDLGLRISNLKDIFTSDKIVNSSLAAGEWVKSDESTSLKVVRRVPDLKNSTVSDGKGTLSKHKLTSETEGRNSPSDIIVRHEPAAGEFIDPEDPVRLTVSMVAPDVEGMKVAEASETLSKRDLKWQSDTRAFQTDRVVKQSPKAGALVEHGATLDLVVHLPVPNVVGLTLEKARSVAADWDINLNARNRLARNEDIVRGQSPAAQTYVAHQSNLNVGPIVMRIPDVRGQSVERAEERLEAEDLKSERYGDLVRSDRVTMQTPAPGEERERGDLVRLDARVRLPEYTGNGLLASREAIQRIGVDLRVTVDGAVGRNDLVYSQQPRGETYVFPRSEVILVPGVNVPQLVGSSPAQADAALQQAGLPGRIIPNGTLETTRRELVGSIVIESQNPAPGLHRRKDVRDVTLRSKQYILAVRTVPNVTGQTFGVAVQQINAAELNAVIVMNGRNYSPAEWAAYVLAESLRTGGEVNLSDVKVSRQDPAPGTRVPAGSTVSISAALSR